MTIHHCIECNAPLSGATRLCSACAEAALERFEAAEYDGQDDDDNNYDDEFEAAIRNCGMTHYGLCTAAGSEYCDFQCPVMNWPDINMEPDLPTEGDTEPNATEYDCGWSILMAECADADSDHCEGCPYRQAIGDVQS